MNIHDRSRGKLWLISCLHATEMRGKEEGGRSALVLSPTDSGSSTAAKMHGYYRLRSLALCRSFCYCFGEPARSRAVPSLCSAHLCGEDWEPQEDRSVVCLLIRLTLSRSSAFPPGWWMRLFCLTVYYSEGLRAYSTKVVAASWTLLRGVCLQDICAAASWSSPLAFIQLHRLDVSASCVSWAALLP